MEDLPLIPFGKYKGQTVLSLLNDANYLEWCKKQNFLEKYPIIYNIVINQSLTNNNLNSKTPEHNKLQNLFLNKETCYLLFYIFYKKKCIVINYLKKLENLFNDEDFSNIFGNNFKLPLSYDMMKEENIICEFEGIFNWDIILTYKCRNNCYNYNVKLLNSITIKDKNIFIKHFNKDNIYINNEDNSVDLIMDYDEYNNYQIYCEIKPLLGDDYPCVLRKMKNQIKLTKNKREQELKNDEITTNISNPLYCNYVLLIKDFNSTNTSKTDLIHIFKNEGIKITFIDELINNNLKIIDNKLN